MMPQRTGILASLARLVLLAGATLCAPGSLGATSEIVVPTEMCGDFFMITLAVSGDTDRPLRLMFDTGASHTLLDPDAVERVSGKRVPVGRGVNIREAVAGPVTFRRLRARVRELDHIADALGTPLDGILGFPAFEDVLLVLDYPRREMRVSEGRLDPSRDASVLPLHRRDRRRPWIEASVGGRLQPVLIDSGSNTALVLSDSPQLDWLVSPRLAAATMRIDGVALRRAGRLAADVSFAGVRVASPVVELTDATPLFGQPILRHLQLTFDQDRWSVRVRRDGSAPIRVDPSRGTGALLRAGAQELEVVAVLPGSPAEAAGVRVGDRIIAVDGRTQASRACGQPIARFGPGVDTTILTLIREGGSRDISVPVVDIVP